MAIGNGVDRAAVPDELAAIIQQVTENAPEGVGAIEIDLTDSFDSVEQANIQPEHFDNLAEFISADKLKELSQELVLVIEEDRESRGEWAEAYVEGLKLLGYKQEERNEPWPGATGVVHPIMSEVLTKFISHTTAETFPSKGPVRAKLVGPVDDALDETGKRVETYMNWLLTEQMSEYRDEHEMMLFHLGLSGFACKKVYYDGTLGREVSRFVPSEDFLVNYYTTDLDTCERYTHIMRRSPNQLRKLMISGVYQDIPKLFRDKGSLPEGETGLGTDEGLAEVENTYDEIEGFERINVSGHFTLFESYVELDLEDFPDVDQFGEETGIALPYIVTIEAHSGEVLAIRRNFKPGDALKLPIQHFAPYRLHPGTGFYGAGYIHLMGGIAKSSTSILRQLIDAGTLANLPGGFKTQGARVKNENDPIRPGEFRDVFVTGTSLKDSIVPLPYKEPSSTLQGLLELMVSEGRNFASISDLPVNQGGRNEVPATTMMAMVERSMKTMTAMQVRINAAFKKELKLLARMISERGGAYEIPVPGQGDKASDFAKVPVIPVSDPFASGDAQRAARTRALKEMADTAPQLYDMKALHRRMLENIGIEELDELIPSDQDPEPMDPATENSKAMLGQGLKAFEWQNHEAHIGAHQALMKDPQMQQNPMAQQIMPIIAAHISEHFAMKYRQEVQRQMGQMLPEGSSPEFERQMAQQVSEAVGKVTGKHQQEAQMAQMAQKQQDPEYQLKMAELEIKRREVMYDAASDARKAEIDEQKAILKDQIDRLELQLDRDRLNQERHLTAAEIESDVQMNRAKVLQEEQDSTWKRHMDMLNAQQTNRQSE